MDLVHQYINGLLFGAGFITAAWIFKIVFHIAICN